MIYFHSFRSPGLILDIVQDIRSLNELSRKSRKAGMIVLGGGVCKHQIANAMLIVCLNASYLPNFSNKLRASCSAMVLITRCSS